MVKNIVSAIDWLRANYYLTSIIDWARLTGNGQMPYRIVFAANKYAVSPSDLVWTAAFLGLG